MTNTKTYYMCYKKHTGMTNKLKKHCLPFDTVSYPRRMESLPVIVSLKTVILILTAIAALNLPFASSDLMAFSESVSMYKWREGVLCGSC